MLSEDFYRYLAGLVQSESQGGDSLYVAIGSGFPEWDSLPPTLERSTLAFQNEIARLPVPTQSVRYVDSNGNTSVNPTNYIQVRVNFVGDNSTGAIRETGLFGVDATDDIGSGQLLSYFAHPRIDKTVDMNFKRIVTLDLNPSRYRLEGHLTRYLGNSSTEELHDLENENGGCRISQLRIDRRHYFNTVEQALTMGYDYCAFCFGRELSQR